jgi:hypothetical protein
MGIKEILGKFAGTKSERSVAASDEAPYDSFFGKNVKLENARQEWRKIEEESELKDLNIRVAEAKKIKRQGLWLDSGGFFPGAKNAQEQENREGILKKKKNKPLGDFLTTGVLSSNAI